MGSSGASEPSRFLEDIPRYLISGGGWLRGNESPVTTVVYSWDQAPELGFVVPELKAGDHVRHTQFGGGVVVSCQPVKDDSEVVVAFRGGGIKKLLLSFAQLEKVE
jgi:hypothetical protein